MRRRGVLLRSGRSSLDDVGVQVGALGVEEVRDSVEQSPGDDDTVVSRCPGGSSPPRAEGRPLGHADAACALNCSAGPVGSTE
jgi:hypothetical protein